MLTAERDYLVRASALNKMLEDTIAGYANECTDREILKFLRMGRTMIQKALLMRMDLLTPDAKIEFIADVENAVAKLEEILKLDFGGEAPHVDTDPAAPDAEDLLPVTLGMINGHILQFELPEFMAIHLLNELESPHRNARALTACHVGTELITIDMTEVVTIQVSGLEDGTWSRPQPSFQPAQPAEYQDDGQRERYRVECKCGAEYFCSMNVGRCRARCRDCNNKVFADRSMDPTTDPRDGAEATLLTNRYWVEQADQETEKKDRKPSTQEYVDPCDPFRKGA